MSEPLKRSVRLRLDPMLYVFERGSLHDEKINRLFEAVLGLEEKTGYRIDKLAWEKKEFIPLQTSDIIAVESRWEICRQFDPAITRPTSRKSLQNLYKAKMDDLYYLDRTHMRAILEHPVVKKKREAQDLTGYVAEAKKRKWI